MGKHGWLVVGLLASCVMPAIARVSASLPGSEEGDWVWDYEARIRVQSRDNADFTSGTDDGRTNVFTRGRFGGNYPAGHGWTFRWMLQHSEAWDPIFTTPVDESKLEIQELYADYQSDDLSVILGRIPLSFGRERLVGLDEWSNVARRFDGIKVGWDFGEVKLEGWFTSLGGSPSTFFTDGEFWGLYATWPRVLDGRTEGYLFWNHDPSPAPAPTNFVTIGARHEGEHGKFKYDVEAAAQVGNVTAFAATGEAVYSSGPVGLSLELSTATGDSTPGVGQSNTFQNLYPSNHDRFGIMDYQSWRNMHAISLKGYWQPEPWLKFQAGFHALWLANSRDFWYGARGFPNRTVGGLPYIDPTGSSGTEVGQELDFVITAKPHPLCTLEAGYAHFFAGPFITGVNRLNKLTVNDSDWWYVQATGIY